MQQYRQVISHTDTHFESMCVIFPFYVFYIKHHLICLNGQAASCVCVSCMCVYSCWTMETTQRVFLREDLALTG